MNNLKKHNLNLKIIKFIHKNNNVKFAIPIILLSICIKDTHTRYNHFQLNTTIFPFFFLKLEISFCTLTLCLVREK